MKNFILVNLIFILISLNYSCEHKNEKICDTFAKQGSANEKTLIGEWVFETIGYTYDGNKINEKEKLECGGITFSKSGKITSFYYYNSGWGTYEISNINAISINAGLYTYAMAPPIERTIVKCINNSICYKVVKENLYIHTKKIDDYNVLIFKKKTR